MSERRNINRGYMTLRVWQESRDYYGATCEVFRRFPRQLLRPASNQIASVDSIHRNIAEGYCRRTLKEYINHLTIARGSLGESVSGLHVYHSSGQLTDTDFQRLDAMAYKLENGLIRLIQSLEHKTGEWNDSLTIKESNSAYDTATDGADTGDACPDSEQ